MSSGVTFAPVHTPHPCDTCVYIGGEQIREEGGQRRYYEFYVCNGVVIARFGSKPDEYKGTPISSHLDINDNALFNARRRAQQYLVAKDKEKQQ